MGVATMANKKTLLVVLVDRDEQIEAHLSANFDIMIALIA